MSSVEMMHSLLEYNEALHRRLWKSIFSLTPEQFLADIRFSHGSIRNQMVHVAAVEGRWLRGLRGDPDARAFNPDPEAYPTAESVFELWQAQAQAWAEYSAALDEAEVERVAPGMRGPAWQIIVQVVNHGTDHRAQVLRALHEFGALTFDQDFILHHWRR